MPLHRAVNPKVDRYREVIYRKSVTTGKGNIVIVSLLGIGGLLYIGSMFGIGGLLGIGGIGHFGGGLLLRGLLLRGRVGLRLLDGSSSGLCSRLLRSCSSRLRNSVVNTALCRSPAPFGGFGRHRKVEFDGGPEDSALAVHDFRAAWYAWMLQNRLEHCHA